MFRSLSVRTVLAQLALLALATVCSSAQRPSGPSLFLTAQDVQRAKQRAAQLPWAAEQEKDILRRAAAFPESYNKRYGLMSPDLPPEGGQWTHYYACPSTGTRLVFHPPNKHVCPDDGKVYQGYPYDQAVYSNRADELAEAAVTLALAYRLEGNRRYAEEAAAILTGYGKKYLTYKMHDKFGKVSESSAHVYAQTLDEAIWLIKMAWAYDLMRDTDVLKDADRSQIENGLLRPAAAVVSRYPMDGNWQSWKDTGLAAVGFTLNDQAMIHAAIDGPSGALPLLRADVIDGFWKEGSWGYQFYAMSAYAQLAQMALAHGRDLWKEEPLLKALFESPAGVTFPDGELPNFNDSGARENLYRQSPLYEGAFAATRDSGFAVVLNHGDRHTREAFLFGVDTVPEGQAAQFTSELYPHIGYARLTAAGSDLTELMKFGPFGGGHGHFDELDEILYSQGRVLSVDPGTQLYGVPSHETWDKMTVAHNSLVVDETSQKPTTGKVLNWQTTPQFSTVEADAGEAYAGVSVQRRVIVTAHYVLEITTANATDRRKHTFDWIYHNYGRVALSLPLEDWSGFGKVQGYQHLSHNRSAVTDTAWVAEFHVMPDNLGGAADMRVSMLPKPGTRVVTGDGLGPDLRVPVPYILARRTARQARFVALLMPSSGTQPTPDFQALGEGRYRIAAAGWSDTITVGKQIELEHTGSY